MNPFKKLYFRTYQKAFHILLPVLPYREPEKYNSILNIKDILIKDKKHKPMIISDKFTGTLENFINMKNFLDKEGFSYYHFDGISSNPTTDMISEAYKAYIENGCDSIISFGGGSVIDAGKALGIMVVKPGKPLIKFQGVLKVGHKIPTLVAIPTTAGTGSEVTVAAVIIDSKTGHKVAINDFNLIPKYAILDAKLLSTLPPHLISTCGMDALTHAMEAFIGRSTIRRTRRYALTAMKLIFDNIEEAYNTKSLESLNNMLEGSYLAGRAFTESYVGNVHAMSHPLSGAYNTPHGYANAVILPVVLEEYGKSIYKKMAKISKYVGFTDDSVSDEDACKMLIERIKNMLKDMNIDYSKLVIKEEDIHKLSSYAYHEANPLYPVPVMFDIPEYERIYHKLISLI